MTRVLIVDDKEENLYFLEALLTGNGFVVDSARHGAEALFKGRAQPPDLIVSDLLMPVMDGYTLLRHWKTDERLKRIPFVVYTATYTEAEDEKLALDLGADAFVLKPMDPEEFLGRIQEILSGTKSSTPTTPNEPAGDEKAMLSVYSSALIRKLEEKTLQLEEVNRLLKEELASRLREQEQLRLLQTSVSRLNDIVLITEAEPVDEPGPRIVFVNQAFERISGYSAGEVIGRSPRFLQGPMTDDLSRKIIRDAMAEKKPARVEILNYSKSGDAYWIELDMVPVVSPDGEVTHFVAVERDITERKASERILRDSERRFRELAENIHEVFWITDLEKNIMLYVSPAYERIWGRSCESLYKEPRTWLESIHPEDRERVRVAAMEKQSSGEYDETYRIERPDGSIRWVHDRAFPVRNEEGNIYRVVGTAEDVTETKKLQAQFLRAQRMESIGTLAGGIAHDLNNILAPITMGIGLLKLSEKSGDNLKLLSTMESSAQRGTGLVRQVLAFARGTESHAITLDPGHIVNEIAKIVQDTFPKNIEFVLERTSDLWTVDADPTQLHQVLMNLCVNARDAMPDGGILTLKLRNIVLDDVYSDMNPHSKPGNYVVLVVQDTGTGISQEIQTQMFDPFFTTKELGQGTGLGLSTVISIVKSHGGFINVYSEVGKGTRFKIYIPAGADRNQAEKAAVEQTQFPLGNGETILLVDDEEAIRSVAQKTLERFGYRVLLANNGAEAVAAYALYRKDIALVLTDIAMPVMDGPATIIALKAMNPDVKILASSGLSANEGVAKALGAGVEQFVPKPYTAETLLKTLHKVLNKVEEEPR